ncbi:MAG: DNA repair protein RadA [Candidatus Aminicenantes bacterium]|nr:MAG: DNA repair protein RadA [Candidatus Aminicenantes bacterium]
MKKTTLYECIECGYQGPIRYGKCPQCETWNSMIEVKPEKTIPGKNAPQAKPITLKEINNLQIQRETTGLDELDRVLGGGVVPDSIVLIGGEPGVGKSTLLLEAAGFLAKKIKKVLYYSGEESAVQIKLRANRLGIDSEDIFLLTMGSLEDVKDAAEELKPDFLIIDSIQTINSTTGPSISGSISSMRYATSEIIQLGKTHHVTVFIIGHITKEGQIAGPKTLEHMVDAVLYFQGELKTDLRILRAEKNRFGSIDEIGVFQMTAKGLTCINDPSLLFLQHRQNSESGISIFPTLSGLRSILIEIQALVTESPFVGNPRRITVGFDPYRMSMMISIIEKKLKLPFYKSDVFLNIAGGMTVRETGADLSVVSALISSYKNMVVPRDLIIIGEVGLTGEIRPVPFIEGRIKEAVRQGFSKFILPASQADIKTISNISVIPVGNLYEFYNKIKT